MEKLPSLCKNVQAMLVFLFLTLILVEGGEKPRVRPAKWAQPIIGTNIENIFIVDSLLFRSAQPEKSDFLLLEKYGIREVLNLRHYSSDQGKAKGTGLILHRVEMSAADIQLPKVIEALKIIKNAKHPLLIHCHHGSDRTGLLTAMYRIVFQNWSKDDAIDEMVNGGFGYHKMYSGIVEFIKNADVDEIRKAVNS